MLLPGARTQEVRDHLFVADGVITAGGASQLLLPERKSTSHLVISNNTPAAFATLPLWIEFGGARATATVSGGQVTGFTVTNGGLGYRFPPKVHLYGGGSGGNSLFAGVGLFGWPAPGDAGFAPPQKGSPTAGPATAHAVVTGGVISSIIVDNPGSGYVSAPYVFLENSVEPPDPFGVADPFFGSANTGMLLGGPGAAYYVNGTHCTTDAISIWGATTGQAFLCRWAP